MSAHPTPVAFMLYATAGFWITLLSNDASFNPLASSAVWISAFSSSVPALRDTIAVAPDTRNDSMVETDFKAKLAFFALLHPPPLNFTTESWMFSSVGAFTIGFSGMVCCAVTTTGKNATAEQANIVFSFMTNETTSTF